MLGKAELPPREKPAPFTPARMLGACREPFCGRGEILPCQKCSTQPKVRSSPVTAYLPSFSSWYVAAVDEPRKDVLFLLPPSEPWGMLKRWSQHPCCDFSAASGRGDSAWFRGARSKSQTPGKPGSSRVSVNIDR